MEWDARLAAPATLNRGRLNVCRRHFLGRTRFSAIGFALILNGAHGHELVRANEIR